jgi:hypothetical protein
MGEARLNDVFLRNGDPLRFIPRNEGRSLADDIVALRYRDGGLTIRFDERGDAIASP